MGATTSTRPSDWLGLRPEERRDAFFGLATLLVIIAGHTLMETARDTLFLQDLPTRHLPWAYLSIAALALTAGAGINRLMRALPRARSLTVTLLAVAGVSAVFWWMSTGRPPKLLFAFYVWTGLAASLVTLQLWLRAASMFDVGRAKRVFTLIGAGGLAGATLGAALASVVLHFTGPRILILFGALLFAAAALVNQLWGGADPSLPAPEPHEESIREVLRREPYLWRLLALTIVATVVLTGLDYLFKSIVAENIARQRLGPFLARYNTFVNAGALVFQLVLAPRVIQGAGVIGALVILPLVITLGAAATAALGGLVWILTAKAADGTLRHSLDRAGNEILHLPLSETVREQWKAVTTGLGQRGGQALASIALLTAVSLGASNHVIAGTLAVLAAAWAVSLVALRPLYVGRFRDQLRTFRVGTHGALPPLDTGSLEILIAALNSSENAEVIAALDMLEAYGKQHLVSPLMVHHPAPEVALRAVTLLADSPLPDAPRLVERALAHPNEQVRAAVLRLRTAHVPDESLLRRFARDPSPAVRCAALVGLVTGGYLRGREAEQALHELSCGTDPAFSVGVARALATEPNPIFVETLLELLTEREARTYARPALVALGDVALDRLERALDDPETPPGIRLHVPRTISRFATARAADILVQRLLREDDPQVRYKILRGLGRMRADDPNLPVEENALRRAAETFLERAATMLQYRVAWDALVAAGGVSSARDLLPALLENKERRALEGVFRVLHILEPNAEYGLVHRGLAAGDPRARAGGREILENVLDGPLRPALLAMTDALPPAARLAALLQSYALPDAELALALVEEDDRRADRALALLARTRDDPNGLLRDIAQHELAGVSWTDRPGTAADAG
jgi:AAA family ATP:ADP antiporter